MDKAFFNKQVLPHLIAIVVFLVVTVIFYHPIVFEGKSIRQNDINQGKGSGQEVIDYREKTGEEALWTNSMFSGMPAYLINIRWSGEQIAYFGQRIYSLFLDQPMRETFIAFISFYIMLLVFGIRPYLAIAGALAYGLNTFFIVSVEAGHIWKVRAIAYMPLVVAGIHSAFKGKWLWGFILTALGMTWELMANHLQVTYYLFLLVLIYGIVQLVFHVREGKIIPFAKSSSILIMAVILAIGANFGRLWTTYEYGQYSIRGASELSSSTTNEESSDGLDRSYAFRWSSGKWESMTLLVPHLYGGASGLYLGEDSELSTELSRVGMQGNSIRQLESYFLGYWGKQPGTSGPVYAGAIICLLFVIGITFADTRWKYWLITAAVFGIVLSWGKNFESFNYFMFDHFPGYNKFRSVTMTVVITLLAINLLGFLGLEKLLQEGLQGKNLKRLLISGGIVAGILLIVAWFASPSYLTEPELQRVFGNNLDNRPQIKNAIINAVAEDRSEIVSGDAYRSLFFVVVALGLIYFYLKSKISGTIFSGVFVLLVALDLGLVDARYINEENYQKPSRNQFFTPTPADQAIMKDTTHYRVLNLPDPFNEARTSAFHHSVGGYHGAKMRRYQDLIEWHLQDEINSIMQQKGFRDGNSEVLSMLNTKYAIAGQQANAVLKNPYANGSAWFVRKVRLVDSPDEEIQALNEIDPDSVAVIDQGKFAMEQINYSVDGNITLTSYQPNKLVYKAENEGDGLAVFSEIYYPEGWEATIDGEEANILRANYVLRALRLPAGSHTITFTFEPESYFVGNKITFGANILLILTLLFGLGFSYRKLTGKQSE